MFPYKKGRLAYRHTQKEYYVQTQGEDSHLQAKERNLEKSLSSHPSERTSPENTFDLRSRPQYCGKISVG